MKVFLAFLTLVPMAWGFGVTEAESTTICADDSDYVGTTSLSGDLDCDYYIGAITDEGIDLSSCDTTAVYVSFIDNTMSPMDLTYALGNACCSSGVSVCSNDFSGMCTDSSLYDGSADFGTADYSYSYSYSYSGPGSCQDTLGGLIYEDLDASSCTDAVDENTGWVTRNLISYASDYCCTDGRSVCDSDYSAVCAIPSNYDGDALFGEEYTCDEWLNLMMGQGGYTFSMLESCDTSTTFSELYTYLGYYCCSSGGSACDA